MYRVNVVNWKKRCRDQKKILRQNKKCKNFFFRLKFKHSISRNSSDVSVGPETNDDAPIHFRFGQHKKKGGGIFSHNRMEEEKESWIIEECYNNNNNNNNNNNVNLNPQLKYDQLRQSSTNSRKYLLDFNKPHLDIRFAVNIKQFIIQKAKHIQNTLFWLLINSTRCLNKWFEPKIDQPMFRIIRIKGIDGKDPATLITPSLPSVLNNPFGRWMDTFWNANEYSDKRQLDRSLTIVWMDKE